MASSERGLGLLYESEKVTSSRRHHRVGLYVLPFGSQVGVATADELSRQKEQLMRTEQVNKVLVDS